MLRDAFNEIRLHPGRFVATLIAIAIAVGFFAAISIVVGTEGRGVALGDKPDVSEADVIGPTDHLAFDDFAEEVRGLPGVDDAWYSRSVQVMLSGDDSSQYVELFSVPAEEHAWYEVSEGRAPTPGANEIALQASTADDLGIEVGGTVKAASSDAEPLTLVGVISGPRTIWVPTGVTGSSDFTSSRLLVTTSDDPRQVAQMVTDVIGTDYTGTGALAYDDYVEHQTEEAFGGVNVFKYVLNGFAVVALAVGIIIIANTFTILITQRRRQIALLRAVGASTGQVRGRLILEALLVGIAGSLLGLLLGVLVSWAVSMVTGSIRFGLDFQWKELLIAFLLGALVTFLAVLAPSLAATRVPPIEALQPVPSAAQEKRIGTARLVVCSFIGGLGLLLVVLAQLDIINPFIYTLLGCLLLSIGILFGAPLYIAPLLRLLGKIFSFAGPSVRMAAENAARNPRRAAATSVALMLAVGLVITLQVVVSTTRSTALGYVKQVYPVDMIVSELEGGDMTDATIERLRGSDLIEDVVVAPTKTLTVDHAETTVVDAETAGAALDLPADALAVLEDGVALVPRYGMGSGTLDVGGRTFRTEPRQWVPFDSVLVTTADFEGIDGEAGHQQAWVDTVDGAGFDAIGSLESIMNTVEFEGGGFGEVIMIQIIVNVLMIVLTTLLGVAVLIALVGVGNTLGLSVLERQRESALLRALGMQRSEVRNLLLLEAMLMGALAVVIGVVVGSVFGWLGVNTVVNTANAEAGGLGIGQPEMTTRFSIDPLWTGGLILVCLAAAALASVLPGLRASRVTPTEALATT